MEQTGSFLITTKKGDYTDRGINITAYTGASWMPNRVDLLNTEQYLKIRRQAFINDDIEPSVYDAYDLILWDQQRYTDWQDFFFGGTAQVQDINISTNGGNENTSFRLSGSFHKQGTIYPGNYDYRKFTGGIGFNHYSPDEKLQMGFSLTYGLDDNSAMGDNDFSSVPFELPPNAPAIFKEDGSLNWNEWSEAGVDNPLSGFFNSSDIVNHNLVTNLNVGYKLLPNLQFKTNLGYNYFQNKEMVKRPKRSYDPAYWDYVKNSSTHLESALTSWIIEPQMVYETRLGKANFSGIVGASFQERKTLQDGVTGEGYVMESTIGDLSAAERLLYGKSTEAEYKYAAIFGRVGVDWEKRYFLNLTGRRDGSSRFGPGKRLANFWSIGGAWIFSEDTSDTGDFLSFGKLRASYGTTGSDNIGDYQYLDAYEATLGSGGIYPTQLYNPDYSWELNRKFEAAVDLGFFQNRLKVNAAWYKNRSSNQLVGFALPAITGFSSVQANLPATVENSGLELEFSSTNIRNSKLSWETFFNLTIPKNKLIKYPGIDQSPYSNVYRIGQPLSISLLYQYDGIDPEAGLYNVVDANGDGSFDYNDKLALRDLGRKFYGGIGNNFRYKNLSLHFLLDFTKQKGSFDLFEYGDIGNQAFIEIEDLQQGNTYQEISQSYEASDAFYRTLYSTFPIVDASFLRLRTVNIGYDFSSALAERLHLKKSGIFLNGQNLFTITNYRGIDPEVPTGGGRYFAGLRTITAGLQVQF